jgi:hypothetical protein
MQDPDYRARRAKAWLTWLKKKIQDPEYNKKYRDELRRQNCKPKNRQRRAQLAKDQNRKFMQTATQTGMKWGPVEDAWLLEKSATLKIWEMAKELGRSIKSVIIRLWRLFGCRTSSTC